MRGSEETADEAMRRVLPVKKQKPRPLAKPGFVLNLGLVAYLAGAGAAGTGGFGAGAGAASGGALITSSVLGAGLVGFGAEGTGADGAGADGAAAVGFASSFFCSSFLGAAGASAFFSSQALMPNVAIAAMANRLVIFFMCLCGFVAACHG